MIFGDIFGQKNWYLSITVHWRDNIDDKNPTNEVVVEGHYFTLLAIITYFGFDHGKILDIFLTLLKDYRFFLFPGQFVWF